MMTWDEIDEAIIALQDSAEQEWVVYISADYLKDIERLLPWRSISTQQAMDGGL